MSQRDEGRSLAETTLNKPVTLILAIYIHVVKMCINALIIHISLNDIEDIAHWLI